MTANEQSNGDIDVPDTFSADEPQQPAEPLESAGSSASAADRTGDDFDIDLGSYTASKEDEVDIDLDFGGDGTIMMDGKNNQVTEADGDADTTIKISWADWQAMADGQLDGMTAFMTGKLKVEGDMSNAMQLQGVLAKLRS